jgi:hypothetical protein
MLHTLQGDYRLLLLKYSRRFPSAFQALSRHFQGTFQALLTSSIQGTFNLAQGAFNLTQGAFKAFSTYNESTYSGFNRR